MVLKIDWLVSHFLDWYIIYLKDSSSFLWLLLLLLLLHVHLNYKTFQTHLKFWYPFGLLERLPLETFIMNPTKLWSQIHLLKPYILGSLGIKQYYFYITLSLIFIIPCEFLQISLLIPWFLCTWLLWMQCPSNHCIPRKSVSP